MTAQELLNKVKQVVLELEPGAEIILYGSRSRGDASADSDWDFLLLVDGTVDDKRIDRIRHRLYELEWDHGEVLSVIVRNKEEWNQFPYSVLPIHNRIEEEGIRL
jgi:predicted nucleotidyltransferase